MTNLELVGDVVTPRPRRHWLTYAIPLGVYGFFALLGLHEGLAEVAHFLVLMAVCVLQLWRPTLLGWAVLFVPVAVYVAFLAGKLGELPLNELVIFLALGVATAVALLLGRPQGGWRATSLALAVAGVAVAAVVKAYS